MQSRSTLIEVLKTFDIAILLFSLLFVSAIYDLSAAKMAIGDLLSLKLNLSSIVLSFLFAVSWHVVMCSCKLYVSRRLSCFRAEMIDILKATTTGIAIFFIFSLLFRIGMTDPQFLFLLWVNTTLFTILGRLALRYFLKKFRLMGLNQRNVVIAGAHERAVIFATEILSRRELGYRLLGFVDDAGEKSPELEQYGYRLVANFDNFNEYLRTQVVDEVAICLPMKSHYQQAAHIASTCEEHGIVVRFLSDIFNPRLAHAMTQQFEGHPIVTFYTGNMHGGELLVKRGLDVVLSLCLIVLLLPVFLMAGLMVRFSSPGPVLFVQKRLGLNKHHFGIYKFRTMYLDAERRQAELEHLNEVDGAAFKIKNDPRITPVGKILRQTSIDELPQLFNVLKGEMSLVGPRPLPIRDYQGFSKDWQRRRFSVRPGITCLWQISGRSNMSFEGWMRLDMEYIDNWSLWLDFKILLGTLPAVLRREGAV